MNHTAENLRALRKAAGLSMVEAARLSQTPYATWKRWEATGPSGRRSPGIAFAWLELYASQKNTPAKAQH
ncbi:MAG: XRE family transcriptional regulator [Chloroflexia bacterium]|nr:XRE family transcriptional regulator [Chloroflexia bacterium]